jgi:hypothetical protein
MSVTSRHPAVNARRVDEWELMRDCMEGESAVKERGERYLPMPSGFRAQDDSGAAMYSAYKKRADFPEILAPSVAAMIGIIHGREIKIEMPDAMNFLWENCDGNYLPLEAFHRRITRELLVIGSYAILADAPPEGGEPYLCGYSRDALYNWDTNFFVLDESRHVREGFVWQRIKEYRMLTMDGAFYRAIIYDAGENPTEIEVRGLGGQMLPRVPIAVGNALDLTCRIETPPLVGVARAAIAMYQLSADYRHQLYMSGQETLVAIDGPKPAAVGAGVVHEMFGAPGTKPDLKYVSPTCAGINAHEIAMNNQREAAVAAGARLFENIGGGQESGEARRLRFASETATLVSIAQNSCQLLEKSLRNIAMIMGMSDEQQSEITVHAPTDLLDRTMSMSEFAQLFGVYERDGMSWDSYFAAAQRGGIFSPEDTPELELERLENRMALSDDGVV